MIKIKFLKKVLFLLLLYLFISNFTGHLSNAEIMTSDVYVEPIIDEQLQIEGKSYFRYDISKVKDDGIQMGLKIKNVNKEPIDVKIDIGNGLTNELGVVYDHKPSTNNSGFLDDRYRMDKIVKDLPERVSLKPNETKNVEFSVEIPKESVGKYIGTIKISKITKDSKIRAKTSSIDLETSFSIGLWLEAEKEELSEVVIDSATFGEKYGEPTINVKLKNNNADFLKGENLEYTVTDNKDKAIFKGKKEIKVISPKNYLVYPIEWEGELKEGDYKLNINGNSFDLTIDKREVKKENDRKNELNTFTPKPEDKNIWMPIILMLMSIYIIWLHIKDKDKESESVEKVDDEEMGEDKDDDEGSTNDK